MNEVVLVLLVLYCFAMLVNFIGGTLYKHWWNQLEEGEDKHE